MTVQSIYTPTVYSADGLGPYTFTWDNLGEDTIYVYVGGVLTDLPYSVVLNGSPALYQGGSVTFTSTAPPTGSVISIERQTPRTQGIDYLQYDRFPSETAETGYDKLTLINQEQDLEDGGGGSGAYLPLAGGTMQQAARIKWPTGSGVTGSFSFSTLFTSPSFLWGPDDTLNDEVAYAWGAKNGVVMYYNINGNGRLIMTGRQGSLADLTDDDVIKKSDLNDAGLSDNPVFSTVGYNNTADSVTFGKYTAEYKASTLANLGAQALVFTPSINTFYQGFKFTAGGTGGISYDVDVAGGQVWLERTLTDDLGDNAPLQNSLITRNWAENFLSSPGGAVTLGSNTWDVSGIQSYTGEIAVTGVYGYRNVFGLDTFTWAPETPASEQVGYNFQCTNSVVMALTPIGGLRVQGQTYSDPTSVLTLGEADARYAPIANWQQPIAVGAFAFDGSAVGVLRGCGVTRTGVGKYTVTLAPAATDVNNVTFNGTAFGSLVGIDIVFSATTASTITVATVRSDTGAAVDVGVAFTVFDRGLT